MDEKLRLMVFDEIINYERQLSESRLNLAKAELRILELENQINSNNMQKENFHDKLKTFVTNWLNKNEEGLPTYDNPPTPPIPEEPKEEKPKCKGVVVERYECSKYVSDNVYFPNTDSYYCRTCGDFTDVILYFEGGMVHTARFRTSDIKAIY